MPASRRKVITVFFSDICKINLCLRNTVSISFFLFPKTQNCIYNDRTNIKLSGDHSFPGLADLLSQPDSGIVLQN